MIQTCACGSAKPYDTCCAPFHSGKKSPASAEDLLRARYTAFVVGKIPYIIDTHHSETRKDVKQSEIEEWSKDSEWLGLEVEDREAGGADDAEGALTFHARYRDRAGKEHDHHERSIFKREAGEWKFWDAQGIQVGSFKREEPKTGRNDPCPCGSGKKFKKCHAA